MNTDIKEQLTRLGAHAGHAAARRCAVAADFDATLHGDVVGTDLLAGVGAGSAELGAYAAGSCVELALAEHKISRCRANLRAIHHDADMPGVGVFAACLEAVGDGLETDPVTMQTLLDAQFHLVGHVFSVGLPTLTCGVQGH